MVYNMCKKRKDKYFGCLTVLGGNLVIKYNTFNFMKTKYLFIIRIRLILFKFTGSYFLDSNGQI